MGWSTQIAISMLFLILFCFSHSVGGEESPASSDLGSFKNLMNRFLSEATGAAVFTGGHISDLEILESTNPDP